MGLEYNEWIADRYNIDLETRRWLWKMLLNYNLEDWEKRTIAQILEFNRDNISSKQKDLVIRIAEKCDRQKLSSPSVTKEQLKKEIANFILSL